MEILRARPRTIIADDHPLFAAGLEQLLMRECDVLSTAHDGPALLDKVRRLRPDLVLQDLSMAPGHGMEMIDEIRAIDPKIRIVIVTTCEDPALAAEAFRRGVSAYLLKHCTVSELIDAVRLAMAWKSYLTPLMAAGVIESLAKPASGTGPAKLTGRQRDVLRLLAEGRSMKEAAVALDLTARTVAFHKYRMMQMLNIKSSAELVRFAVVQQIV